MRGDGARHTSISLSTPICTVVPIDAAGVVDQRPVDGLAIPVGGYVPGTEKRALGRLSALVGKAQAFPVLLDGAGHRAIATAIPGALQVGHTPAASTSATTTPAIAPCPESPVGPSDAPAVRTESSGDELPLRCNDRVLVRAPVVRNRRGALLVGNRQGETAGGDGSLLTAVALRAPLAQERRVLAELWGQCESRSSGKMQDKARNGGTQPELDAKNASAAHELSKNVLWSIELARPILSPV